VNMYGICEEKRTVLSKQVNLNQIEVNLINQIDEINLKDIEVNLNQINCSSRICMVFKKN